MPELNREPLLTFGELNLCQFVNQVLGADVVALQEQQLAVLEQDHVPAAL